MDSPVQIKSWKSSKLFFFFENSFNKDKPVGPKEKPMHKKKPLKFALGVELAQLEFTSITVHTEIAKT